MGLTIAQLRSIGGYVTLYSAYGATTPYGWTKVKDYLLSRLPGVVKNSATAQNASGSNLTMPQDLPTTPGNTLGVTLIAIMTGLGTPIETWVTPYNLGIIGEVVTAYPYIRTQGEQLEAPTA